jgi:glucan phosphoethanolaminetransferase (alkaline phosphatase superfamily)
MRAALAKAIAHGRALSGRLAGHPRLVLTAIAVVAVVAWVMTTPARDTVHAANKFGFSIALAILAAWLYRRRHLVSAALAFGLGWLWLACFFQIWTWARSLGSDSFSEAQVFDGHEAWFYLSTLAQFVTGTWKPAAVLRSFAVMAAMFFAANVVARRTAPAGRSEFALAAVVAALALVPVFNLTSHAFQAFERNALMKERILENYSVPPPKVSFANTGLNVVLYIGESTSSMHMGLYGYPRPTTPRLSALAASGSLIVVRDVLSTHTHTTPSLFEALSLELQGENDFIPVVSRKRVPLVEVLAANGVRTELFSNQGQSGLWTLASSVLFAKARRVYSTNTVLSVGDDSSIAKPFDADFLLPHLKSSLAAVRPQSSTVIFLHSYAGHGPYALSTPPAMRGPVDNYYRGRRPEAVFGDTGTAKRLAELEAYDAAVRYVDASVGAAIDAVAATAAPAAFVYFADHGEAPFTGAGHDSTRFIHDMSRVPFVIYFNAAARASYPAVVTRYEALARRDGISSLAQLSATVLDLLGGEPDPAGDCPTGLGERCPVVDPILIRATNGGHTYVSVDGQRAGKGPDGSAPAHVPDTATEIFALSRDKRFAGATLCYHRTNTIAKAVRASAVTNCLEVDVTSDDAHRPDVYHPPKTSVGLDFGTVAKIAESAGMSLWIDAKNLEQPGNCEALLAATQPLRLRKVLVEFPPATRCTTQDLRACTAKFRERGYATSYYVPTKPARKCTADVAAGNAVSSSCREVEEALRSAVTSGCFTDFSFDYAALPAMSALPSGKTLRWNPWGISPAKLPSVDTSPFNFIILSNSDQNSR